MLGWLVFGNPLHASKIAGLELITKVLLYFLHERLWNIVPYGRLANGKVAHWRSILKSISYRFFGTLDTIILSLIITGHLLGAITLGGIEVLTKIGLFYLHERLWAKVKWGRQFEVPIEAK